MSLAPGRCIRGALIARDFLVDEDRSHSVSGGGESISYTPDQARCDNHCYQPRSRPSTLVFRSTRGHS